MTSEDQVAVSRELVRLAIAVALEAPYSQNKYAFRATVKWSTIKALRDELEKNGVNWRKHHRRNRKNDEAGVPGPDRQA